MVAVGPLGRRRRSSCTGTGDRAGHRRQGGVEAPVGEDRRVDAAGEVAQLDQRLLGLAVGVVDQGPGRVGVGVELLLGPAQVHGQGDQSLLRAVVQVALDAAALDLDRVDDP